VKTTILLFGGILMAGLTANPELGAAASPPSKSPPTTANPHVKPETPLPSPTKGSSSQSNTGGSRSRQEAGSAAAMPGGSAAGPSSGPASPIAGSGSTGASAAAPTAAGASDQSAKPPTPAANAAPGVGGAKQNEPAVTQGAMDKKRMTGPSGTPQR
jgi:hypothetical protein